jgi:hypothetical protein
MFGLYYTQNLNPTPFFPSASAPGFGLRLRWRAPRACFGHAPMKSAQATKYARCLRACIAFSCMDVLAFSDGVMRRHTSQ